MATLVLLHVVHINFALFIHPPINIPSIHNTKFSMHDKNFFPRIMHENETHTTLCCGEKSFAISSKKFRPIKKFTTDL